MDEIKFPILYKKTKLGQTQQWQINVVKNGYYTIEGITVLTTSEITYCSGKNIGKANETTDEEQALIEAKSKYQSKIDSGYALTVETSGKKFFEPMSAKDYQKYKHLCFKVPTYIQPKLDGIRCYMNDSKLTTRNGKEIVSCQHLNLPYFGLDGELYNHELKHDFNKIVSLVRTTKPTENDLKESEELIQYWVYDYPFHSDLVFSERFKLLKNDIKNFPKSIRLVPTYQVGSEEEVEHYHSMFLALGYEGSMLRLDSKGYENKRTTQLLKYKNWKDGEFEIVDVIEGKGNRVGCANVLTVKLKDSTCDVTTTGTVEYMKSLWKNRKELIGKEATVKYFGFTEDDKFRFPTLIAIRDYE